MGGASRCLSSGSTVNYRCAETGYDAGYHCIEIAYTPALHKDASLYPANPPPTTEPLRSALTAAHAVYALHSLAIVLGLIGAPTVVGSFIGSVPSIIAVVLNYLKRSDARGTWAESHYRWQIRTFWFAVLWVVVAFLLIFTFVGTPLGLGVLGVLTLWLIYRIGRGWMRLHDRRAMYV